MSNDSLQTTGTVLYIPHGGGPLPLLGDPGHDALVEFLTHIPSRFPAPSAIVVISAHWEQTVATITSGATPALIYDYGGFPEESYQIKYPAPGDPELAQTIFDLLQRAGIQARLDETRGFDHGLFVPLKIMYPRADIPCVQLSLLNNLDARAHIHLGKALSSLRKQNILILGSGYSFHNLPALFRNNPDLPDRQNEAFEDWLNDCCTDPELTADQREQKLIHWTEAPFARYCHPREEHLLPLHVCSGVSKKAAQRVFDGHVMGKRTSAYLW